MRLLLIDANFGQADWLAERMADTGFVARLAQSIDQVLARGLAEDVAAVLIDSGLSSAAPAPAVRQLRQAGIDQPLIVLSARGDWRDKVECLDAGADDFLLKPIRSEEIAARLRALIRRGAGK
ncbi:MAG: response regulator, partial [Novosphingobium sp.]